MDRGHPRAIGFRGFRPLEVCNCRFKCFDRGIRISQINLAGLGMREDRVQIIHAFIEITDGWPNRSRHRSVIRRRDAFTGMDRACLKRFSSEVFHSIDAFLLMRVASS